MEQTETIHRRTSFSQGRRTMESPRVPEELLALIADYAASDDGSHDGLRQATNTLRNLCLTSKAFQRLAQPLLFRKFTGGGWGNQKYTRLLLRTLLETPRHASAVQEITLDIFSSRSAYSSDRDKVEIPPPADLTSLYRSDLFPSFESGSHLCDAYTHLCHGMEDAEILLLLLLCPNITALSMIPDFGMSDGNHVIDFLQRQWELDAGLRQSSGSEKRMLPKLKRFHFEHGDTENSEWLEVVRPVLALPQLQHLDGDMIYIGFDPDKFKSNVTEIHMRQALWDDEGFTDFLRTFPKLEILELEAGGVCVGECSSNFATMGEALRKYGKNIKRLDFEAREASFEEIGEWRDLDESVAFGSLKELKKLEYLKIPIDHLVDADREEEDVFGPAFVAGFYDTLQNEILPDSCREVIALNYFRSGYGGLPGRPARPNTCLIYQGTDGTGMLKLHLCREGGRYVGDTCSENADYSERVVTLGLAAFNLPVTGDFEDEDEIDDDDDDDDEG